MRRVSVLVCGMIVSAISCAQWTPDAQTCAESAGTAEDRIAACTRAIISGQLPRENLARTFYNRGVVWDIKNDHDRAITDYNEAIRLNPQYAQAYYNRGVAWGDKRDYDRAIADYDEATRLNPQYTLAYRNRAMAWYAKGKIERGTAGFNETIRINPRDASNYNAFAWRLAVSRNDMARDGKRAIELAMQACEMTSWNVANYLDTLAAANAEAGQFPEAIRWQEKSLEFPEFVKASGTQARERLNLYRSGKPYRE